LNKPPRAYDPDTVVVGVAGRPHGLHGELWVRPFNAGGPAFEVAPSLIFERDGVRTTFIVDDARLAAADGVIVKLHGVDDRDAAAALTLSEVRAARADLPPLEPGEYYVEDLVGCAAVRDDDGAPLGVVAGTFWNGAHDVMTVVGPGGEERMIPVVPDFVLAVDGPGRKIRVRCDDDDD
jgi:16S rRNA processing protein RimM